MISITAIIKSTTETRAEIRNMLDLLVTETRKETACVRYDLHTYENIFILWEEWENQEGLNQHNIQPYIINFITKSENLISSPIQVYKTYQSL